MRKDEKQTSEILHNYQITHTPLSCPASRECRSSEECFSCQDLWACHISSFREVKLDFTIIINTDPAAKHNNTPTTHARRVLLLHASHWRGTVIPLLINQSPIINNCAWITATVLDETTIKKPLVIILQLQAMRLWRLDATTTLN